MEVLGNFRQTIGVSVRRLFDSNGNFLIGGSHVLSDLAWLSVDRDIPSMIDLIENEPEVLPIHFTHIGVSKLRYSIISSISFRTQLRIAS